MKNGTDGSLILSLVIVFIVFAIMVIGAVLFYKMADKPQGVRDEVQRVERVATA